MTTTDSTGVVPPVGNDDLHATVRDLQDRVAELERRLDQQQEGPRGGDWRWRSDAA